MRSTNKMYLCYILHNIQEQRIIFIICPSHLYMPNLGCMDLLCESLGMK